ncbi:MULTISPECIES: hypothetical protein [unclassified Microcoleus]|uniref:hypothetical protein n=1 Tax=unclassified Microcoleus TaxID=2642155 RepID=UPI002FCE77F6
MLVEATFKKKSLVISHWAWGMGHGAWGMGHGAWGMGHGASCPLAKSKGGHGAWGIGLAVKSASVPE